MYNIQNSRVIIILKVMTFKLISKRTNRFFVGKLNVRAIPIFKYKYSDNNPYFYLSL